MTKKDYYVLREEISMQKKIDERLDFFNEFLFDYGQFENSTLREVKDYLWKRHCELENSINSKINVE